MQTPWNGPQRLRRQPGCLGAVPPRRLRTGTVRASG